MLIRFEVDNWKSFRRLEFSAIASDDKEGEERLASVPGFQFSLLPTAAIFGANASGKSGFCDALRFARDFVVEPLGLDKEIPVNPFKLSSATRKEPTRFWFQILVETDIFEYEFSVNRREVLSERLIKITNEAETVLFARTLKPKKDREPAGNDYETTLDDGLEERETLRLVEQGTQNNVLFLTNGVFQRRSTFKKVFDWFKESLVVVSPRRLSFDFTQADAQEYLDELGLDVERVEKVQVPFDETDLDFRALRHFFKNDEISAKFPKRTKLVAVHKSRDDDSEVTFDLKEESDGTVRAIALLSVLAPLYKRKRARVLVIDEIDRSLHCLLVAKLIELYVDGRSPESRSQLLFTTHDPLLMTNDLLRRDEMWLVDKNSLGESSLASVADYIIDKGEDVLKLYLFGRLGGVPRIR